MTGNPPSTTTTCNQCNLPDHKLLHPIRLTSTFRRLCTTCVLRLHPKSFCPTCLAVYHPSPPQNAVFCYKCHSTSHRTCVAPSNTSRTLCATCVNPNAVVFEPKLPDWSSNGRRRIDLAAARLLVAAAEISAVSMSKAAAAAVMEAEWRVKEAAEWKVKAKDAINHVVKIMEVEALRLEGDFDVQGMLI